MVSIKGMMEGLNVQKYPERWNKIYEDAMKEYEIKGAFFADKEYIMELNQEFDLFTNWLETVLIAAKQIKDNSLLSKYIYLLYYAMQDRKVFPSEMHEIEPPLASEDDNTYAYDFVLLFALLPMIPESVKNMKNRSIPEELWKGILKSYEGSMNSTYELFGKPGLSFKRYLSWFQLYIDAEILRIGRLNFNVIKQFNGYVYVLKNKIDEIQMLMANVRLHKGGMVFGSPGYQNENLAYDADFCETKEYFEGYPVDSNGLAKDQRVRFSKADWRVVLSPKDPVIGVHIPSSKSSGRLTKEICEESYLNAREIFSRCYPEYEFKGFSCNSWMMDSQLRRLLSDESGIVQFQNKYLLYPRPATGKAVFSFIFNMPSIEKFEDLPEHTSLLRALKYHYLDGKYIYEHGGVFLWNKN